jgi:hypothetical protein
VYKNLLSLSHIHAKASDIVPKLKNLEQQFGEFNEDEKVVESLYQWYFDPNYI